MATNICAHLHYDGAAKLSTEHRKLKEEHFYSTDLIAYHRTDELLHTMAIEPRDVTA